MQRGGFFVAERDSGSNIRENRYRLAQSLSVIFVTHHTGGLTNQLTLVSIPENLSANLDDGTGCPSKLLIRYP